jgi:hypothetical protein
MQYRALASYAREGEPDRDIEQQLCGLRTIDNEVMPIH